MTNEQKQELQTLIDGIEFDAKQIWLSENHLEKKLHDIKKLLSPKEESEF